ncbi:MAG: ATP-binding cassette domain-containing protein [Pyrinomonadaceae bacterium]
MGIIGPNGAGKTTFLKTLLGNLPALGGEVRWGSNVQIGYYAQQLDDLDVRNEIIMELRRVAPASATAGELRSFLARFLFTGDDVYKHVADLSGGEKGRLALAKLIYSRVNVLVLDEPTNHLDIPSREALEEALAAYEGTILTISHDRYFLDRVYADSRPDGRALAEHFDGDYTEYHDWKILQREESKRIVTSAPPTITVPAEPIAPRNPSAKKQPKGAAKKTQRRDADGIEAEVGEAEALLAAISAELSRSEVARDKNRLATLNDQYRAAEERVRTLYEEWERASALASKIG